MLDGQIYEEKQAKFAFKPRDLLRFPCLFYDNILLVKTTHSLELECVLIKCASVCTLDHTLFIKKKKKKKKKKGGGGLGTYK